MENDPAVVSHTTSDDSIESMPSSSTMYPLSVIAYKPFQSMFSSNDKGEEVLLNVSMP
jgi:hypothetical protein